ncbi:MAG: hypothetical protein K0R22_46 [Sporomusa sp.]|jgi:hypothetical protein|nr:hypothetical protein [Sporomusa sp.]
MIERVIVIPVTEAPQVQSVRTKFQAEKSKVDFVVPVICLIVVGAFMLAL